MTRSSKRRSSRSRSSRPLLTARKADRHDLYQRNVQEPSHETRLLERVFEAHTGRRPLHLREDFCGTALLCAHWAKSHPERTATGLDTSRPTLEWGRAHNLSAIGDAAERVTLLEQDVLEPTRRKFEVIGAYNYSYQVFHERAQLLRYFRATHRSLAPDGLFALDAVGGYESMSPRIERRRLGGGVTYIWEQESYDPVNGRFVCHISFEFKDGSALRRCFTYDWRHYSLSELRDLLFEAGYVGVDAYWEGTSASGRSGSGVFHRVTRAQNEPVWNAYLVARKGPPLPGSRDAARTSKKRGR
ncbi:MAG: class I SAM-dependent methyltransferase [Deltaproteobacteria bacterium]|nr:class I SAM-dependent methyltransferase [Deltaproteobacteria bacterium]